MPSSSRTRRELHMAATEQDVVALHCCMIDEMRADGGTIDDLRFCPTHPEAVVAAYRGTSDQRKPGPGMFFDLSQKWESIQCGGSLLVIRISICRQLRTLVFLATGFLEAIYMPL